MVVIIDDRADVWEWSPNLIKVIPCQLLFARATPHIAHSALDDFFVGIGDINSAFLPKLDPILAGPDQKPSSTSNKATPVTSATPVSSAAAPTLTTDAAKAVQDAEDDAALDKVTQVLDAQLEERPLAKKQDELADADADAIADAASKDGITEEPSMPCDSVENGKQLDAPPKKAPKAHKQALLKNDDYELVRVQAVRSLHPIVKHSSHDFI
jgi:RNA polymerase II subunit A-like phosphatase